jgi:hypothetical protein
VRAFRSGSAGRKTCVEEIGLAVAQTTDNHCIDEEVCSRNPLADIGLWYMMRRHGCADVDPDKCGSAVVFVSSGETNHARLTMELRMRPHLASMHDWRSVKSVYLEQIWAHDAPVNSIPTGDPR